MSLMESNNLSADEAKQRQLRAKAKGRPFTNMYRFEEDDTPNPETPTTPTPSAGPDNPTPSSGRVEDGDDANLSPEERTYKKRYGDLRRLHQKDSEKLTNEVQALKAQLEDLRKSGVPNLPKTKAEIQQWMQEYPDLAATILHIADERTQTLTAELKQRMERVEEDSLEVLREKAYTRLLKIHPDADEIRESEEFHNWVTSQPEFIQAWFYENDTDHVMAAKGIDLFKAETGWGKSKRKAKKEDLTTDIPANGAPPSVLPNAGGKKVWKESEIAKLSGAEFEKYEADIEEAMMEGRIEFDVKAKRTFK